MADPTVTNVDVGQIAIEVSDFEHHVWTAAGADTLVAGTIVARITSTGKWQIYAKGGSTDGNGIAKGVLTYDAVATGAGDVAVAVLVRGTVNQDRLIIDADGDGSNVDETVIDDLLANGILAKPVGQLGQLDNQT